MLTHALPEGALHYAENAPAFIMTDNCDELRRGLHRNCPNAALLLCVCSSASLEMVFMRVSWSI